jgi:hypothetical protein
MLAKHMRAGVLVMFLAACLSLTACANQHDKCLVIRQHPSQHELQSYPLGDHREFALTFIHSVSKTPVRDEYRIDSDKIIQTAEIFEAHGAGLPSDTQDAGAISWESRDDRFVLHLQRPIPQLVVRTDRNYHNHLLLADNEINLCHWDDQALELSIESCDRFDREAINTKGLRR